MSPSAKELKAEEEAALARRVSQGREAMAALACMLVPGVKDYLRSIAGDDGEVVKLPAQERLAKSIVNRAFEAFATARQAVHLFHEHFDRAFRLELSQYLDRRHRDENDFWIEQEEWVREHVKPDSLRQSLNGAVFAEATLWQELSDAGDTVDQLAMHGMAALVPAVLRTLELHGLEILSREDAESESVIALRDLAWKFKPSDGQRFHAFAFPGLKKHLKCQIRKAKYPTEDVAKKFEAFAKARAALWLRNGSLPSDEPVLDFLPWGKDEKEHFRRMLPVANQVHPELDATIESVPHWSSDPLDELINREELTHRAQTIRQVRTAFGQLSRDHQEVLTCRVHNGLSKAAAARLTGKSLRQVERLEKEARQAFTTEYDRVLNKVKPRRQE